ncbi:hypothetical protein PENSPDRAFT_593966, partial [Peniophora sp. CONT]
WTPDGDEYQETVKLINISEFDLVVTKLEAACVAHLIEMDKLGLARTCYHERQLISKAITRRTRTLRALFDKYQNLAPLQDPPRPLLTFQELIERAQMYDFSALRSSGSSASSKEWSRVENRNAMNQYFKLVGAHAEIQRCNDEIGRVKENLDRDDEEYRSTVEKLLTDDPILAAYVAEKGRVRAVVNESIRDRLRQIAQLKGYTGPPPPPTPAPQPDTNMYDARIRAPDLEDEPDTVPPEEVPDEEEQDLMVRLETGLGRVALNG